MDKIKQFSFAKCTKMESPYKGDNRLVYHLFVNVKSIPEGLPTEVNPREVNSKKIVYKKIVSGLTSNEDSFFVNNRGILIAAKKVTIDSLNNIIKLDIGNGSDKDNYLYGVLDGGHTYHAILNNRNLIDDEFSEFVHLEIMTNVRNIDELSSARNTSVQVSDKAIAELADKFEFVKKDISNTPFAKKVSYRENEDKPLDAVDLIKLMYAFNIKKFPNNGNSHPIQSYSGKQAVLKDYLNDFDNDKFYRKISPLLPVITNLYDKIEVEMVDAYNEIHQNGKFGKVKGVDLKVNGILSKYYSNKCKYQISQGLIFPIIAAFRALITESKNQLDWEVDPFIVWDNIKPKLVNNTIEMSRSLGNNPQSAGKNTSLWSQNFDAVNTEKLQILINKLRSK
ncbi:AIPR family protein [Streptococcus iniae]|uniref:AIPR family protein n=1 Tax=Streptococcus iniae TaxID=1346 RepID=UPI0002830AFB|nr:AIPR family protein [Streptococcus iniae]EKB51416.1 hypothetical protein A0G_1322 [Streptococcus iniae 9117]RLU42291.1 hypothetical protein DIY16_06860 [Streptococcus iniae]RLV29348.1 hypothetical protein DIX51_06900 [Streptococcus iniae]RMI82063.1 hypothetical protein DIX52_06935 [Streptococcus iniae]